MARGSADVIVMVVVGAIIITVAIILAVHRLDVNPLATPTPYATPTPSPSATLTPTPSPTGIQYDAGQAFTQVEKFYTDFGQNSSVLSKYVTLQLAAQLNSGGSPSTGVYCTFNVPSSISYNAPASSGNAANVVAHESFVNSPDIAVTVTVSLNTLLITAITCP